MRVFWNGHIKRFMLGLYTVLSFLFGVSSVFLLSGCTLEISINKIPSLSGDELSPDGPPDDVQPKLPDVAVYDGFYLGKAYPGYTNIGLFGLKKDSGGKIRAVSLDALTFRAKVIKMDQNGNLESSLPLNTQMSMSDATAIGPGDEFYVARNGTISVVDAGLTNVTTLRNGGYGHVNALAVDSAGNVYVGLPTGNIVYKVDPLGNETTFATLPDAGWVGDILIDSDDTVFVLSRNGSSYYVQKYSSAGTLVGGAYDFPVSFQYGDASPSYPKVMVWDDLKQNIYFVGREGPSSTNYSVSIKKYSKAGVYNNSWSPNFRDVMGIIDVLVSGDTMYLTNGFYQFIKYTFTSGEITSLGSSSTQPGELNSSYGRGLEIDSLNNIYVLDYVNPRLQVFNSLKQVIKTLTLPEASTDMRLDKDGNIYAFTSESVYKYDSAGNLILTVTGVQGEAFEVLPDGRFYVGRYTTPSTNVRLYGADGVYTGTSFSLSGILSDIRYLPTSGNLLFSTGNLVEYTPGGAVVKTWNNSNKIVDVTVDSRGYVYALNSTDNTLYIYDQNAKLFSTITNSVINGITTEPLVSPRAVAVDSANNIYLMDVTTVRRFSGVEVRPPPPPDPVQWIASDFTGNGVGWISECIYIADGNMYARLGAQFTASATNVYTFAYMNLADCTNVSNGIAAGQPATWNMLNSPVKLTKGTDGATSLTTSNTGSYFVWENGDDAEDVFFWGKPSLDKNQAVLQFSASDTISTGVVDYLALNSSIIVSTNFSALTSSDLANMFLTVQKVQNFNPANYGQ